MSDLFKNFPKLKFIIPHGGGAVPFHWGRFRGIALNNGKPELAEIMGNNIFFDTCVYHQPGIDLLTKVVPIDNILFASEMVGAVKGNDPKTGLRLRRHQALRRQGADSATPTGKKIFEGNARKVYSRLKTKPRRRRRHRAIGLAKAPKTDRVTKRQAQDAHRPASARARSRPAALPTASGPISITAR